ncbi:MAG TPA: IS630 transposase-related protein, partial [Rickettsia endosymbiont of Bembidion nr. Transversale]|nr:IS630 transposase-related protein [Rickettsia endosymbiont of Bembidion nr. Transversale]
KAYSYDLRIRVIKSLTDGKTIKETSEIYSISRKTIIEWNKPKKDFSNCLSIISIILLHGDLNKL